MRQGKFVVFEGLEASGKSTQATRASQSLAASGRRVYSTAEPTDGPHGKALRETLRGAWADPVSIALAFALDRNDHLKGPGGILDMLHEVDVVLCDRYLLSSIAYQTGRGVDKDFVAAINKYALIPDLTVFVSISPETSARRLADRGDEAEIFDHIDDQRRVYANYLESLSDGRFSSQVSVIDGERSIEAVTAEVIASIEALF